MYVHPWVAKMALEGKCCLTCEHIKVYDDGTARCERNRSPGITMCTGILNCACVCWQPSEYYTELVESAKQYKEEEE